MTTETQNLAVRSFLRSLNILLKSARMYGMSHPQTNSLLSDTWKHLQVVLSEKKRSLELALSGNRLLVDGVALKGGPAERGLADLLSATDLGGMTFTIQVTPDALARMVRVFAESATQTEAVGQELKKILGGGAESGIRIYEVGFVRTDSERPEGRAATEPFREPWQQILDK